MIKSISALACLFAFVALVAGANSPIERSTCVAQSADYLAQVEIEAPVMTLVTKSREFYPDVSQLIEDDVPSDEYTDAMLQLGKQNGCDAITEHFRAILYTVPCYETLEMDETSTFDIVELNDKAKEAYEAYFACTMSV